MFPIHFRDHYATSNINNLTARSIPLINPTWKRDLFSFALIFMYTLSRVESSQDISRHTRFLRRRGNTVVLDPSFIVTHNAQGSLIRLFD